MLERKRRLRFEIENKIDLEFGYAQRIRELRREVEKYEYRAPIVANTVFWIPFLGSHLIWDKPGWTNEAFLLLLLISVIVYFVKKANYKKRQAWFEEVIESFTSKAELQCRYLDSLAIREEQISS